MPISDASRSSDSGPPEGAHLLLLMLLLLVIVVGQSSHCALLQTLGRQWGGRLHKKEKQSVCS